LPVVFGKGVAQLFGDGDIKHLVRRLKRLEERDRKKSST
jgi:hypothetical protein